MPGFSLRKPTPKTTPTAAAPERVRPNAVEGMGTMPFAPGEVITTDIKDLTPQERADLTALGWTPGMVIPADLARKIAAAKAAVTEDIRAGIQQMEASGHVLQPPKVVDINDLPQEHKDALAKSIKDAQDSTNIEKLRAMHQAAVATIDPKIKGILDKSKNIEIYDDRVKEEEPVAKEAPPRRQPQPPPTPESFEKANATSETADKPAETGVALTNCPHCNWRLADEEPAQPGEDDKLNFANAVWDGSPFFKQYTLMGGKIDVIYRTLTVKQAEVAMTQIAIDQKKGRCFSVNDMWERLMSYRTVLGILKIKIGGETLDVGAQCDSILQVPVDLGENVEEGDDTQLVQIMEQLTSYKALKNEFVWRMIRDNFKRFSRLYELLEARADDESFWKAIEG